MRCQEMDNQATTNTFKVVCDYCDNALASVFCAADGAFLCPHCDGHVHNINKLAQRHVRVPCQSCPVWAYREAKSRGRLLDLTSVPPVTQNVQMDIFDGATPAWPSSSPAVAAGPLGGSGSTPPSETSSPPAPLPHSYDSPPLSCASQPKQQAMMMQSQSLPAYGETQSPLDAASHDGSGRGMGEYFRGSGGASSSLSNPTAGPQLPAFGQQQLPGAACNGRGATDQQQHQPPPDIPDLPPDVDISMLLDTFSCPLEVQQQQQQPQQGPKAGSPPAAGALFADGGVPTKPAVSPFFAAASAGAHGPSAMQGVQQPQPDSDPSQLSQSFESQQQLASAKSASSGYANGGGVTSLDSAVTRMAHSMQQLTGPGPQPQGAWAAATPGSYERGGLAQAAAMPPPQLPPQQVQAALMQQQPQQATHAQQLPPQHEPGVRAAPINIGHSSGRSSSLMIPSGAAAACGGHIGGSMPGGIMSDPGLCEPMSSLTAHATFAGNNNGGGGSPWSGTFFGSVGAGGNLATGPGGNGGGGGRKPNLPLELPHSFGSLGAAMSAPVGGGGGALSPAGLSTASNSFADGTQPGGRQHWAAMGGPIGGAPGAGRGGDMAGGGPMHNGPPSMSRCDSENLDGAPSRRMSDSGGMAMMGMARAGDNSMLNDLDAERTAQLLRFKQKRFVRQKVAPDNQRKARYDQRRQFPEVQKPRARGRFAKAFSSDNLVLDEMVMQQLPEHSWMRSGAMDRIDEEVSCDVSTAYGGDGIAAARGSRGRMTQGGMSQEELMGLRRANSSNAFMEGFAAQQQQQHRAGGACRGRARGGGGADGSKMSPVNSITDADLAALGFDFLPEMSQLAQSMDDTDESGDSMHGITIPSRNVPQPPQQQQHMGSVPCSSAFSGPQHHQQHSHVPHQSGHGQAAAQSPSMTAATNNSMSHSAPSHTSTSVAAVYGANVFSAQQLSLLDSILHDQFKPAVGP